MRHALLCHSLASLWPALLTILTSLPALSTFLDNCALHLVAMLKLGFTRTPPTTLAAAGALTAPKA
eukprot:COSAG02_NODE_2_length_75708_cov_87.013953_33_plen_66_part_00